MMLIQTLIHFPDSSIFYLYPTFAQYTEDYKVNGHSIILTQGRGSCRQNSGVFIRACVFERI